MPGIFGTAYVVLQGIAGTLVVTFTCFTTAIITGLVVAVLRRLHIPVLGGVLNGLVYLFRSIPVLIAVFLVYFGLPSFGITVPPLPAMNISIGLISGSYLAEVFRGALELVDRSEREAAETAGFSRLQIITNLELPQMFRFSVPGVLNEFSSILKASPFAYTIGISEMTRQAMTLTAVTMNGLAVYSVAGLFYFTIYRISVSVARAIESRLHISAKEIEELRMKEYGIDKPD
ncbi:amino acid ABC transporter permease [Pantoea vagans]|uniref:amino acid ABC transporter permease n=1 Tax=Pantoea vagans TaxID=470934 RepID=UPI0023AE7C7B|nr:amino acid ABC transporter permease [Pantoea vagans]MDE8559219.1 amino acid ABC transporter permease [Pantoea vagans]MDE8579214.1 amino acid ABC transporter permease [Pantoea vagans]